MVLTVTDHRAMMKGFENAGFICTQAPAATGNPIRIEWHVDNEVRRYRLWAFDVTHGGGGSEVRAADEFRIQITNGPAAIAEFDKNHTTDLLVGYSRDRDAIVAYDRGWLEKWSQKKEATGSGGSPSVQVKEADIQAGHDKGIHHLTKNTDDGTRNIVTMSPAMLPAYLLNHGAVLRGEMIPEEAQSKAPRPAGATVADYCRSQGFPFEPDLIARYLAALLAKPFVILAGDGGWSGPRHFELPCIFQKMLALTDFVNFKILWRSPLREGQIQLPVR